MDSQLPLKDQHALITGASRGIGLAIARRLGQMGARISICGRDEQSLDAARSQLQKEGIETFSFAANVADSRQVSALVEAASAKFGHIEILVNNAGIGRFGPVNQLNETDWDTVLDTNLKGVFLVSRAVMEGMISRGRGHIVNISSPARTPSPVAASTALRNGACSASPIPWPKTCALTASASPPSAPALSRRNSRPTPAKTHAKCFRPKTSPTPSP